MTINFSLRQWEYAIAVADLLSFRKAAERCHVSQPSLSVQLQQLEGSLGVRLFERDRRRVLVTVAGRPLIERARRMLIDASDLMCAARQAQDPLVGTMRIGVIPTVSPYLLPRATAALRAKFPRLITEWTEDKTSALSHSVEEGTLDAALLALEAKLGDFSHATVAIDPFVLVARPRDPLASSPTPLRADALRNADVLFLDDGHCFREQALAFCTKAKAHELAFRATSLPTLTQMVAGGSGVTLLPRLAVATEVKRAKLRVRAFADPAPHRTLALVWRKQSPMVDALRQIAGAIRDAYPRTG